MATGAISRRGRSGRPRVGKVTRAETQASNREEER